ncbi:hypothetical protein CsSME_00013964 [Camellia sinensis var. sinensis]
MALPIVSLFWLPSHSPPFFPFSDLATVAVAQSGGLARLLSQMACSIELPIAIDYWKYLRRL